jgi:tight adherence protein B
VTASVLAAALTGAAWLLVSGGDGRRRRAGGAALVRRASVAQVLATWWSARRRGSSAAGSAVAACCSDLATLFRAGLPPAAAWAQVAARPVGPPLDGILREAASAAATAGPVAGVLRRAGAGSGHAGIGPGRAGAGSGGVDGHALVALATAWEAVEACGAAPADVLDRLAEALRAEVDAEDARRVALAGPRATARLLCALPPAGLLLGEAVGVAPLAVLTGSAAGLVCLVAGAVLAAVALVWTRRLVAAAARAGAEP